MTEISEAAKRKACELANKPLRHTAGCWEPDDCDRDETLHALARVLQEHSDVAKDAAAMARNGEWSNAADTLQSLILPDDPDPLDKFAKWLNVCSKDGKKLQEAAAMFGLKLVEAGR